MPTSAFLALWPCFLTFFVLVVTVIQLRQYDAQGPRAPFWVFVPFESLTCNMWVARMLRNVVVHCSANMFWSLCCTILPPMFSIQHWSPLKRLNRFFFRFFWVKAVFRCHCFRKFQELFQTRSRVKGLQSFASRLARMLGSNVFHFSVPTCSNHVECNAKRQPMNAMPHTNQCHCAGRQQIASLCGNQCPTVPNPLHEQHGGLRQM